VPKLDKKEIKRLDDLAREIIRGRDRVCQWCGKDRNLQVCHFTSRSNFHTRWALENLILLCAGCHFWAHKNPMEFTHFMENRLSPKDLMMLQVAKRQTNKIYFDDVMLCLSVYLKQLKG